MRAILSVSDKTGLIAFARGLAARGVQLVSTGGTAKAIADAGLAVTNVSDVTGFPEMMDGRVKTLHPKIHGGILARRHRPDDLEAIKSQGVELVDLVVVNLYPFEKAASNPETPFDELIEQIDIGGPSLLRAAGKNFRDVMVVVDPADYPEVLEQLARPEGPTLEFKFELMKKAFSHTAQFDAVIAQTLATITCANGAFSRGTPRGENRRQLRYGENPHQAAEWLQFAEPGEKEEWNVHQGKELSYPNLLDLDAATRIVLEFTEPAAVVIKHTNPCGTATGATIAEAYVRAREADPLSAFGGIIGLNRAIDVETAKAITSTFIEAVMAPSIEEAARPVLATKTNLRVVTTDFPALLSSDRQVMDIRSILGGALTQVTDRVTEARAPWPPPSPPSHLELDAASAGPSPSGSGLEGQIRVVTKRQPTAEEWTALRFAWRVCAHVKSNTIVFTGADRTLAVGAGQMSRVDSVKVAVMKAAPGSLAGSVVASDAFFPFRDGLDAVADAGATAVVQPGGSVKDAEVIAAADERGLAMVFTGRRHFRH
ncbi:MAG TPA: bifunctional phosphoribosylaminoimidazolecarboxamide formyltransferase/IMP cyclohydrolase [Vicinamibacterales bacterium]|nr:bifunctional phosphoribosylaminoimidazolecarboxamide formyltransferase/IMP cyclohydrolase [Vicinamibacterales bacterium]